MYPDLETISKYLKVYNFNDKKHRPGFHNCKTVKIFFVSYVIAKLKAYYLSEKCFPENIKNTLNVFAIIIAQLKMLPNIA